MTTSVIACNRSIKETLSSNAGANGNIVEIPYGMTVAEFTNIVVEVYGPSMKKKINCGGSVIQNHPHSKNKSPLKTIEYSS